MLIYENIENNAIEFGDKISIVYGEKTLTYKQLSLAINSISKALSSKWNPLERIIIKLSNKVESILYLLALSKLGLSTVLVDNNINTNIMNNIIKKVNPIYVIDDNFVLEGNHRELPPTSDSDIFLGILSSGTSGEHKVIWRDHKSWTSAFNAQSSIFSINSNDTLFLSGSLVYSANLNSALHILNEGGRVIFSESPYPRSWIKEINENNVTSIFMVPSHYRILVKNMKEPLYKIKSLVSAGEKMDRETAHKLIHLFPKAKITEYYGASELGHISYIDVKEIIKGNSLGKAFPKVNILIEDETVFVESPYIAPSFRPKATVGDIGRIDENGNLYVLGRKSDVINKGGIKLSPWEIENVLNTHPKISKSIVFGIKHETKGEQVAAIIIKNDSTLTYENIIAFCKNHLPKHSHPQRIRFVKSIPLNENIKINRKALAQWFIKSP